MTIRLILLSSLLAACGADTNAISIELAPDVISSLDGTLALQVTAFADREPAEGETIDITVAYTDRNGTAHNIPGTQGVTNASGTFETVLEGFTFDGTGSVTAAITGVAVDASATFAVLDRTPPTAEILPESTTIQRGNGLGIDVHVTDEIGVSQVFFESTVSGGRSTVIASGATDDTLQFFIGVNDGVPIGTVITIHALAADLSGNQAAAAPVTVTVVP